MRYPNALKQMAAGVTAIVAAFISSPPANAWTETALYSFRGGSDGAYPLGEVIGDQNGNFFGTTLNGGGACGDRNGCGTVFKLTSNSQETVLYAFSKPGSQGAYPRAGLAAGKRGNLYGGVATRDGVGVIFKINGNGAYSKLYKSKDVYAPLILDNRGNLYGTSGVGGGGNCYPDGCGIVFRIT